MTSNLEKTFLAGLAVGPRTAVLWIEVYEPRRSVDSENAKNKEINGVSQRISTEINLHQTQVQLDREPRRMDAAFENRRVIGTTA